MRLDKGIVQYPDANSTMRLTYGTVGGFNPRNAVYATLDALSEMKTAEMVAALRGKKVEEII